MFHHQIHNHLDLLLDVRGECATLTRGNATCPITVALGRANNGALTKNDMKFESNAQDFLCRAADYAPGHVVVEPAADDTFTIEIAGRTCIYEVRPFSDSEQVCTLDPTGQQLRVHTKLISRE